MQYDEKDIAEGLSADDLHRYLATTMSAEARGAERHPTQDQLAALREGRLPATEEEDVLAHVGRCRECSEILGFYALAETTEADPAETDAAWTRFRRRLEAEGLTQPASHRPAPSADRSPETTPGARWWRSLGRLLRPRPLLELAGAMALLLLGIQVQTQDAQLAKLQRPSAAKVVALSGAHYRAGGESAIEHIELTPAEGSLVLSFSVDAGEGHGARLVDQEGRERWSIADLPVDSTGVAVVTLPRGMLDAGRYELLIETRRPGETPRTAVYDLEIQLSPDGNGSIAP